MGWPTLCRWVVTFVALCQRIRNYMLTDLLASVHCVSVCFAVVFHGSGVRSTRFSSSRGRRPTPWSRSAARKQPCRRIRRTPRPATVLQDSICSTYLGWSLGLLAPVVSVSCLRLSKCLVVVLCNSWFRKFCVHLARNTFSLSMIVGPFPSLFMHFLFQLRAQPRRLLPRWYDSVVFHSLTP